MDKLIWPFLIENRQRIFRPAGSALVRLCSSGWVYVYIWVEVAAALAISVGCRNSIVLVALDPLLFFPVFVFHVYHRRIARLFATASFWGVWKSLLFMAVVCVSGGYLDEFVSGAPEYHADTLDWILTGEGTIAHPEVFAWYHLAGLWRVSSSAAASAGLTTLVGGSRELNIMNYHVAQLLLRAKVRWRIVLFGWPIWSLLRGWAYLFVISATAPLFFDIVKRRQPVWRQLASYGTTGLALAGVDLGLKVALAPLWRLLLVQAL